MYLKEFNLRIYYFCFYVFILSVFPSVLHYGLEFFISFTTCADVTVVLAEFFESDDSIFFLGVPERHELHEEVSFGFIS